VSEGRWRGGVETTAGVKESGVEVRQGSLLARGYEIAHKAIAGSHPDQNLLHYQFFPIYYLRKDLRSVLQSVNGDVLDAGCGRKPYRPLLSGVSSYTGLDILQLPEVDIIVGEADPWPVPNEEYDVVLSFQVIEHVRDLPRYFEEVVRVLKGNGQLLVSLPFLYQVHGGEDFRRWTAEGIEEELIRYGFEVELIQKEGGIGSILAILWLSWLDSLLSSNFLLRICKGVLLPVFLILSLLCNLLGLALDRLDRSGQYYSNLLVTARKV
jgi:SAM-dependent methyltransferase